MLNLFHKDPARLLHEATQKKERGDIDGAIESLQVAYSAIIKTTMDHTVQTFLRLPLYLQQAGKPDEAWAEFNKLLVSGYPNQLEDRDLWPMTRSQIYDKMRLFLQRENRPDEAIRFGIFSYLSWGEGLDAQGRLTELRQHRSVKSIEKRLGALLKKASKAKKNSDLSGLVAKSLREPESMDYDSIGELVANLLTEQELLSK
ncbi:hypothetical protein LCGC14_2109700 [marine sediment metagenome]|uniref:Uncharacterized protein n=1 Tax=marine sediment metagenome TaxID=412755 RepID=A0A0F9E7G1_9ZZZZ